MLHEREFSGTEKCGHCANVAPMEVVAKYSEVRDEAVGHGLTEIVWQHGPVHEMLQCAACKAITLRSYHWDDNTLGEAPDYHVLYPAMSSYELPGLPIKIARAYEAARRIRTIDPNAYAVLAGRVVELVCDERGAKGKYLSDKLRDLADRNEIPPNLVPVATTLRELRNVGAHSSLGELTAGEVPLLDDLVRSILEYVYSAAFVARCANERLELLIARRKARQSGSGDASSDQGSTTQAAGATAASSPKVQ